MSISIDRCWVEHHQDAIGIGEPKPRISWRFKDTGIVGWKQTAYDVEITRESHSHPVVYTTHTSDSVLVPWPAPALRSGEAAVIRIRAYGYTPHHGATAWSDSLVVEAGLLDRSDWKCDLISAAFEIQPSLPKQPVLFRKTFTVSGEVAKARLYITAQGVYEAHLNSERVGDHVLAPGWTSYNHHLAYQTFDVTDTILQGHNIIAVQVAEGWFCGRLGFLGGKRNIWGNKLGLLSILVIDAVSGTRTVIGTDTTWRSNHGSLVTSEIYDGEVCDLRREVIGWLESDYDDTLWSTVESMPLPRARLVAPDGPPIRIVETLPAREILTTPSGKTVVDFAQNLVGWVRIKLRGAEGQVIKLIFTEELENGEIATRPLRLCRATDTITLSGKDQLWEPKFTFHGFRYVQIEGLPTVADEFDLESITAVVIHTDMERTGWFECSHTMLNQLHKNIVWGMKGNFVGIPTDCPQRDERLGWTGDIHVFAPSANFLYNTSGMLQNWLKDIAAEQLVDNGSIPPFFCPDVPVDDARYPTALWGDVLVGLPWAQYNSYGDSKLLQRQLPSMRKWMEDGIPRDEKNGLWQSDSYQFGDWLDPQAPPDDPGNSSTDPQLVANAYLVEMTRIMHKILSVLAEDDLALSYAESAAKVKAAFQARYLSPEGRIVADTQTALALAIHFQLFDTKDQERTAAARLEHLILRNSRFRIATGFAGTPVIGHALSRVGKEQLFYRMLYHRKPPSWLYQVSMGATTMWERWDSKLPDGSINPGEMTSFNHYSLGAVADWMHCNIAGLCMIEPGWKRFKVAPTPGGDLTWAKAKFMSPYGLIRVRWTLEDGSLSLNVRVPPNTEAQVILPGNEEKPAVHWVGSGDYVFRTDHRRPAWPPLPLYPQFYPHDDDEP